MNYLDLPLDVFEQLEVLKKAILFPSEFFIFLEPKMYFYWIDRSLRSCLDTCPIFFKEDLQGEEWERIWSQTLFSFFSIEILDDHLIV